MTLLNGKKGLIVGIANAKSIASSIAEHARKQGAELAITYLNETMEKRVRPIAEELDAGLIIQCDATNDDHLIHVRDALAEKWGKIDFIVHAVAFSNKEELSGRFSNTSRENFNLTMDVSCYTLISMTHILEPILNENASILTLSYYGAEKVVPNYNVMGVAKAALEASVRYLAADMGAHGGIRVNAISAGPIKTLAASGIGGFRNILKYNEEAAPLRRNVSTEDVGKAALFFLSDLSTGVTGEISYVDAGANTIGAHVPEV